ncbi:hypothetical protein FIBSPDRAFT_856362 [Athelia psychrophila]|uniref:Uncharacterized protein n=1 Tax=Athelia psychrophila TaxID=1759441 RepID=A0A166NGP1_9AGAM|nr:hypothetical protein FIBSPDRAFT_856362 [Fibularhizoctonia sp. CBS 109695]
MKKQKKKKTKPKQKPFPQTYPQASESKIFDEYGYPVVGQSAQRWPGSVYNSYSQASTSFIPGPARANNSSAAPLLDQGTLFQAQGQMNIPLGPTFQGGYYNPMLAPSYQQSAQSLPPKPSYPLQALPAMLISESVRPMADARPSASNAPSMPPRSREYETQGLSGESYNIHDSTSHVQREFLSDLDTRSRRPLPSWAALPADQPPLAAAPSDISPLPRTGPKPVPTVESSSTAHSNPLPIGKGPIGMIADSDPGSHGMFTLAVGKRVKPACAVVMENVPRVFRTDQFIRGWSKRTAGIVPSYYQMNDKGKVLLVYQSPELAKKAFDSPRMPHGKGQEGIRLWWYRDAFPGVQKKKPGKALSPRPDPSPAMIDLEEGEIEEAGASKERHGALPDAGRTDVPAWDNPALNKKARKRLRVAQLQTLKTDTAPQAEASYSGPMQNVQVKDSETRKWTASSRMNEHSDPPQIADEDVDSIASSVPCSPLPDAANEWGDAGGRANDDDVQDMDLESPVSPRYSHAIHDSRDSGDYNMGNTAAQLAVSPTADIYPIAMTLPQPLHTEMVSEDIPHLPPPVSHTTSIVEDSPQPVIIAQPTPVAQHTREPFTFTAAKSLLAHRQTPPTSTPTPPSDAPSEPRAMRNAAARGPRTLSERTRELEQRLARSKNEMGRPLERTAPPKELAPTSTAVSATSSLPQAPAHLPARPPPQAPAKPAPAKSPVLMPPAAQNAGLPARPPPIAPAKSPLSVPPAAQNTGSALPPPPAAFADEIIPAAEQPVDDVDKLSMEENLRRLVLQSRKVKSKPQPSATDTMPSGILLPVVSPPTRDVEPSSPLPPDNNQVSLESAHTNDAQDGQKPVAVTSLDDLAVSFINEAVQGNPLPSSASVKIDLAAKQKRLEQHISESKRLMAKLTTASSKAEKDSIFGLLREQSRMMDADITAQRARDSPESDNARANALTSSYVPARKPSWPETSRDVVLDLSDDEED